MKLPEAVDNMLVVEQQHLLVGQGNCCELQAPSWQVNGLQAEDVCRQSQMPEPLALAGEGDEGVVHGGHEDGLLTPDEPNRLEPKKIPCQP